jgi:hypothetical protein
VGTGEQAGDGKKIIRERVPQCACTSTRLRIGSHEARGMIESTRVRGHGGLKSWSCPRPPLPFLFSHLDDSRVSGLVASRPGAACAKASSRTALARRSNAAMKRKVWVSLVCAFHTAHVFLSRRLHAAPEDGTAPETIRPYCRGRRLGFYTPLPRRARGNARRAGEQQGWVPPQRRAAPASETHRQQRIPERVEVSGAKPMTLGRGVEKEGRKRA